MLLFSGKSLQQSNAEAQGSDSIASLIEAFQNISLQYASESARSFLTSMVDSLKSESPGQLSSLLKSVWLQDCLAQTNSDSSRTISDRVLSDIDNVISVRKQKFYAEPESDA